MPAFVPILEKVSLLVFLVASMLASGLVLKPRALLAPLRDLRFVFAALALNFLLSPALAWLLVKFLKLDGSLATGLLLLGGAAGAPFLPKLIDIARVDAARGIALMALLTAGTLVFLPLALPLLVPDFSANPWELARPLLLWIACPLAAGMALGLAAPGPASRAAPLIARAGSVFLVLFFALLVATHFQALLGLLGSRAPLAATLQAALLFGAGWWLGGPDLGSRGSLALGTAARNFGAALAPAAGSLRDPQVLLMLVASAIAGVAVSFAGAFWIRRRSGSPAR